MYRPMWITQTVSADQLWFSNVNCPKISEQRWFISEQPWFNSKHSWTGKVSHLRTGTVSALTFSWSGLIESWTAWISYGTELNRSDLACQFEWLFLIFQNYLVFEARISDFQPNWWKDEDNKILVVQSSYEPKISQKVWILGILLLIK